jgi:DMSO/TMAO reductase YedYZ molybdopterin-dependent catalytic subunit
MWRIKYIPRWTSFVAFLAIVVLVLSCSQLSPGLDLTPVVITSTSTSTVTASPSTVTETPPVITVNNTITTQAAPITFTVTTTQQVTTVTIVSTSTITTTISVPALITTITPYLSLPTTTPASNDLSGFMFSNPANVDNSQLYITPIGELHATGSPPEIDIVNYRLTVDGLVDTPLSLTYDAIMHYPTVTEVVLLICPEFFVDNAEWTGVPVATILAEAGIQPQASQVTFYANEYRVTFLLGEILYDSFFLAHTVDSQVLPREHGYPLRLVAREHFGSDWVKWIDHIEVK